MCGIAGIVGLANFLPNIKNMLLSQKHRGPDALNVFADNEVVLGHNRLSIIDLSSNANQPMTDASGRYTIVFNGEIYNYLSLKTDLEKNYTFKTKSDTEVLLYGYIKFGSNFLAKLKGMFAFAIWDNVQETLFVARDRFGVKPLYYAMVDNNLIFASEINSIHASNLIEKKFDQKVWSSYFTYGTYGAPTETFYQNIHQLEPGSYFIYKNDAIEIYKWYDFVANVQAIQQIKYTQSELEDKITDLLNKSISYRFVSDVPVGFNLSGGLDSSLLLGLIQNQNINHSQINAFTFYTNDDRYDELFWVEKMIKNTPFNLHKCLLDVDDVPNLAAITATIQAEPFGGIPTIAYGQVFKKAASLGVKVLLDGQGSDEAWAGYDYYNNNSNQIIQGVTKSPFRPNVLENNFANAAQKINIPKPFGEDELLNLQYRDLFYTKIPRALRFNDRMSMMYGTELREPFLDHELVELVFAQPKEFKINNGVQKWFLRKLASNYLSSEITTAPKRPLQTPQREWLSENLQPWVTQNVESLFNHPWFNKDELQKELNNYYNGDNQSSFHIWQWVNLALLIK